MEFLILIVAPVICLSLVLWICKKFNFSIIPEDMKLKSEPLKFKTPKLKRQKKGIKTEWIAEE